MSACILLIDDEPDVEALFRHQFRRELRAGRFAMEFAQSAPMALENGAEALMTKPIDFGTLRGEIGSRIERAA